jgi:transcriptional regulator PpsR
LRDFSSPIISFKDLAPEDAAILIAMSTDIAVVINKDGIVTDFSVGSDDIAEDEFQDWLGKPWLDTVSVESRQKVEKLLKNDEGNANIRWRQINHPSAKGTDIPIQYAAVPLDNQGNVIAVGRYLGTIAALQQQLLNAQQSMERHYWQFRHLETRYRLLFKLSSEAVFIVDSQNQNILESNPYASELLEKDESSLTGSNFTKLFDSNSIEQIEQLLAAVRATGKIENGSVTLANSSSEVSVSISLFPQDGASLYLIRLSPLLDNNAVKTPNNSRDKLLKLVENAPDGFVITSTNGQIIAANQAFLELAELFTEEQVVNESLGKWLGRPGVDLNVLTANLREQGKVRLFATTLRGEYGSTIQVEISATSVVHGEHAYFAFIIRDIGLRLDDQSKKIRKVPRPVQQLTELVGRVPLKELVQESTDMIERYCIEAALEITGDNRASAAEMLGLSRQSLYTKLRRYGLGDLAPEGGD